MDYQISMDKYRNCKCYIMKKETLKEIELNMKKLNMLSHEVLLLHSDLEHQFTIVDSNHIEHKGKAVMRYEAEKNIERESNTKTKLLEEETNTN